MRGILPFPAKLLIQSYIPNPPSRQERRPPFNAVILRSPGGFCRDAEESTLTVVLHCYHAAGRHAFLETRNRGAEQYDQDQKTHLFGGDIPRALYSVSLAA